MKVPYWFVTGMVEVEVPDEWGQIVKEENRLETEEYFFRKKKKDTLMSACDVEGSWFEDDINLEADFIEAEERICARDAFTQLTPQQRELMEALYMSEEPLSQREYAHRLGVSEETIKQRAKYIRNKLRGILEVRDD